MTVLVDSPIMQQCILARTTVAASPGKARPIQSQSSTGRSMSAASTSGSMLFAPPISGVISAVSWRPGGNQGYNIYMYTSSSFGQQSNVTEVTKYKTNI